MLVDGIPAPVGEAPRFVDCRLRNGRRGGRGRQTGRRGGPLPLRPAADQAASVRMLPTPDSSPAHDPYAALRVPDFRRLVSARVLFTVASQIQGVVVGWQIYELTRNPLALGLIGLAEAIPSITVSLYAGHVADSVPRKRIIVPMMVVLVLCSLSLFWAGPAGGGGAVCRAAGAGAAALRGVAAVRWCCS